MHRAARLIPPLIWYVLLRVAFYDTPVLLNVLHKACLIYLIVAVLQLVAAFLDTLYEISSRHETLRNRPLKGVYQMIKLLAVCVGAILIVSILIGQDATAVLAGLGASAAIIMLIFRDSILGLVAGVQLSANDMLRPGDWITMAKYGADGYVTEVTLTTVKVQNFDKTITTIPPYALVSDSPSRTGAACGTAADGASSCSADRCQVRCTTARPRSWPHSAKKGWPGRRPTRNPSSTSTPCGSTPRVT